MTVIVHDPDVLLGIIGIDGHVVRPTEQRIPLRPRLDDLAFAIDHDQTMLPAVVHAMLTTIGVIAVEGAGQARPGTHRGVAPGKLGDGERQRRTRVGVHPSLRRLDIRQLAPMQDIDPIRTLREDTLAGAVGPVLMPG